MSRSNRRATQRRRSVLESLKTKCNGGFTTHAAKLMVESFGGTATVCTITHYCRTMVLEYPGCRITSEDPIPPLVICADETFRATVVSNLPEYFQQDGSEFPHYAIDVSLRDGIDRAYRKELRQRKAPDAPIFLVTEQYESVPATKFANGECFLIDEWRDGRAVIEGGREGKRALLAIRTVNGAWPDFSRDQLAVNTVLAAVKVEQDVVHPVTELYSCSCFVSEDGRAVYSLHPTMSVAYGGLRVSSPVDTDGFREKIAGVQSICRGLRRDSLTTPQVAELIDSILLDETKYERYFRLWYLRLWQAMADAKKILGQPDFEEEANAIERNLTPIQLREYRHSIAHWWTGNMDFSFVTGIQKTVQEILRRKYRNDTFE